MGTDTQVALTDEELARQSLAGSLTSFEELVHRHEARVYRFVCQRCGNPEDARDITQAAFVSAFRNLRQFTARSSFRSWLYAIARNRTIDTLRARRTHEPVDPERLVESATPASVLEEHEKADALWALARGGLSVDQFETLWLRYQEDLSVREVARALHRTETGVKVTLFRARQKLAELLRAQEESGEDGSLGEGALPERRSAGRPDPQRARLGGEYSDSQADRTVKHGARANRSRSSVSMSEQPARDKRRADATPRSLAIMHNQSLITP